MSSKCLIAALILAAGVAGCGPIYQTSYELIPPNTGQGQSCVRECRDDRRFCSDHCEREAERCRDRAWDAARDQYYQYARQRRERGQKIERDVDSFYSDYRCDPQDCVDRCDDGFRQCFATCGGTVVPHTVCTAFCDKGK